MKSDDSAWIAGLELGIATSLVALMLPWSEWLSAEAAPAWVQAIGSVLAIVTAIWVAYQQANTASRAREDEAAAALLADRQAAVALIRMTAERVGSVGRSIVIEGQDGLFAREAGPGALEEVQRSLTGFPFWMIREQHCIVQFSHVPGLLDLAVRGARALAAHQGTDLARMQAADAVSQNLLGLEGQITEKANLIERLLRMPAYVPPEGA